MKHSDDKVIAELKRQSKAEKEYNRPFIEARKEVQRRQEERETAYKRFKRFQTKQYENDEKLREFLGNKS